MPSRTFTLTVSTEEEGRSALMTLLTPSNLSRAVRDFIQESMAPGKELPFKVTVESGEGQSQTAEGRIPSPEELRERIEQRRREAGIQVDEPRE